MATSVQRPIERRLLGSYDYPTSHRVFELFFSLVFVVLFVVVGRRVTAGLLDGLSIVGGLLCIVAVLVAYGSADLMSGVVHFLFDTFGSPQTRVIGQKFVKPFRDHHDDPAAMARGDFIAVNGDNLFVCLLLLVPAAIWFDGAEHIVSGSFLMAFVVAVVITNQIHKWTHMPEVPRLVRIAQASGVILSPERHSVHHTDPFDRDYCITWGRLNPVLNRLVR